MFGPGSNREPVFPSYRGQPPSPAKTAGRSRRDYSMFEDRGDPCSLLVFIDDATGKLMQLR
ncbi:hypothetical protein GOC24_33315, partial [Sinorhizobium meliloti]|nr:hypothetical protein [Sinorhizobium meliloti]